MTTQLSIMSGMALQSALEKVVFPTFEHATGIAAAVQWAPSATILKAIVEGARPDVVVLTDGAAAELLGAGIVETGTCQELASSLVGLAVRAGDPKPDISTPDAFCRTLLDSRSVIYSRTGASGIYFDGLISRLGIAEEIGKRATVIPTGLTAEHLVAGDGDLAIQQISELLLVSGVEIVGPLPLALQTPTVFTAAILAESANREAANHLLALMGLPDAQAAYRASGLEPL